MLKQTTQIKTGFLKSESIRKCAPIFTFVTFPTCLNISNILHIPHISHSSHISQTSHIQKALYKKIIKNGTIKNTINTYAIPAIRYLYDSVPSFSAIHTGMFRICFIGNKSRTPNRLNNT